MRMPPTLLASGNVIEVVSTVYLVWDFIEILYYSEISVFVMMPAEVYHSAFIHAGGAVAMVVHWLTNFLNSSKSSM